MDPEQTDCSRHHGAVAPGAALLTLLVRQGQAEGHGLRIPMISEKEVSFTALAEMGFQLERETIGYVAANQRA